MVHVLIVDDELSIRETFQAFLEEDGYDVTTAANFFEAESFLTDHSCDVIVADIIMPHTNGLALLQRVREIDEDIPVVLITGEPDVSTAAEAMRSGAYDYVAKPVTQRVLNRVVGRAAEKKRLLDEQRRLEAENRAYQAGLEQRIAERTVELEQRNQEMAALIEKERDSRRLADTLREITQALNSTLSLNDVLGLILAELEKVIAFDSSSIMLLENKDLVVHAVQGFANPDSMLNVRLNLDTAPLNYEVVESKRPLIIGSVHEDERWLKSIEIYGLTPELHDIRSWMGIPLLVKGRVIGMLTTDKVEAHFYDEQDAEIASVFANQAAIAIQNARLFEETRKHVARLERTTRDLKLVHQVSQVISSSLDLTRILEATVEQMVAVFEADHSGILLFDQAQTHGQVVAEYPPTGATAEWFPVQGYLAAERIIADREPLVIKDTWNDPLMATVRETMHRLDIRSMLIAPLIVKGEVVGSIGLDAVGQQRCFDAEEVALAQTIANQVSIVIENARLFEETQQRAHQLEALTEIGRAIGSTLDLDEVLQLILAQLEQVIPYDAVSLWLREGETMRIQAVRGFEASAAHLGLTLTVADDALVREIVDIQRPLILADAQQDERFRALVGTEWVRSWLGVPLLSKGKVIGLATINKREPGLYTGEIAELALAFGQQAALAIENAQLYAVQQQRAAQLESLNTIAATISQVLDPDEVLNLVVHQAAELMEAETVAIPLLSEDGTRLIYAAAYGPLAAELAGRVKLLRDTGICTWVMRNQQGFYSDDLAVDEREGKEMKEALGLRTVISAPMVFKGEAIGTITAINKRDGSLFTRADLEERLQPLAHQAAIAIQNARLFEETKQRADEMMALYHTSLEIGVPTDLPDLLWTICDRAAGLLDVDKGGLYLYDEAREELELVVSYKLRRDFTGTRLKLGEGISGRVVQTGKPLTVDDYSHWEGRTLAYEEEPFTTVIGMPLRWQEQIIGVLTLSEETERRTFTPDDERLLGLFAQQAAVAIESARLYEEAKRHVEELTVLHAIDIAIASTLKLDQVLQRVYEQVSTVMDTTTFHIALYDEEKNELYLPIIVDQGKQLPPQTFKVENGLSGWVVRTREPLWVEDMEKEQDTLPMEAIALGAPTRSLMVLPLVARDKVVGVISAQSYEPHAFDEGHRRLFSGIASQVAIAIENARLFEETNRRLAETRLLQEIMRDAASTLEFDQVLERTIEALHRTLGIEYLNFALPDEGGTVLVTHPSMIGFSPSEGYFCLPLDKSVMGRVYQTEEPVLIPDVRKVPYYFEGTSKVRSELAVPIKVSGRVIAVLNAESPVLAAFDEDDLRLFTAIAAQLGVVLENTRLYQTLQERTEELSQAYEELKELDRLRTELVQNVGHELRTPLTLVQGYVELLLAGDLGHIPDNQQAALQIVHERTDTLAHLIHNLTMLQTMPREALMLAPVSAVAVVQHALTGFRRFARETSITFREELPPELPPVLGDQEQLELAFSHLVDNAVKFSPDGGTITLRAWADKAWVYVSVADEGIGIAPEHMDRIFERFYQVNGTPRRRFGGMGVGLALVWEIIQAHEGTVNVESKPGQGSTFTVALPQA